MPKKPVTKLKQYPIRIDAELWKEFKATCARKGLTMIRVLTELIRKFIKGEIEI